MGAGTDVAVAGVLVQRGGKRPDMLSGGPASYAHSVHIVLVDGDVGVILVGKEGVRGRELVAGDPATDPGVDHSDRTEQGRGASGTGNAPPTGTDGALDESEIAGAGLARVTHVQVSHSHPAAGVYEPVGHVAVDSLHTPPPPDPVVSRLSCGVTPHYVLAVEGRVAL